MRYYGKQGAQCRYHCAAPPTNLQGARQRARSVLFGRVPRGVVLGLGLGLLLVLLTVSLISVTSLHPDTFCLDQGSALLIRR